MSQAAKLSAEESIEAARERINRQRSSSESLLQAQIRCSSHVDLFNRFVEHLSGSL
jgi:hypothetical protein